MKPIQRGYIPSYEVPEIPPDKYDEYWVAEARQSEVEHQLLSVNTNLSGRISGYNFDTNRVVKGGGGLAFEAQTTTQPKLLKFDSEYITLSNTTVEIQKVLIVCSKVGIGTCSTPTEELKVVGDTLLAGDVTIQGDLEVQSNVAIGHDSPTSALHVQGDVNLQAEQIGFYGESPVPQDGPWTIGTHTTERDIPDSGAGDATLETLYNVVNTLCDVLKTNGLLG